MLDCISRQIEESDQYYEQIAQNVWLMSNHKWAWYAWECSCKKRPAKLIHLDYHWDDLNDFQNTEDVEYLRAITSLSDIVLLTRDDRKMLVRQDSFIAPAIIRRLINEIHFFCVQQSSHPGFDSGFLAEHDSSQYIHSDINDLLGSVHTGPLILDIDLDLFNRTSSYFNENELTKFLSRIRKMAELAEVITIAKSDQYSWKIKDGVEDDWDKSKADYVSSVVVPKILQMRGIV